VLASRPCGASLKTLRTQRRIFFSFAAETAANEKQSASGGAIIDNLKVRVRTPISTSFRKFPEGMLFFLSALSAERKKKKKLSDSAVKTTDPFSDNIKPPVLRMAVDYCLHV
jgi:hypothetical protein